MTHIDNNAIITVILPSRSLTQLIAEETNGNKTSVSITSVQGIMTRIRVGLSASGAGALTIIVGNAGIAMVENALCQFIYTDTFDAVDMLFDGVIGAISGAIAGKGSGTKNLMNLGTQTVKRTFNTTIHKGLKSGLKEAGKAAKYYIKNTAKYYKEVLKKTPKDIIYAVGTDTISDYIKDQYNRIFGG